MSLGVLATTIWLLAAPALAVDPEPAEAPRPARAVPPGTPPEYAGQRPVPPYWRWPEDGPRVFDDRRACGAWFRERVPVGRRAFIGRFDVVHRRCVRVDGGWAYRESHAPTLLDPVLEPLLFGIPFALWLDEPRKRRTLVERGLDRFGCGAECATWNPEGGPVGRWRPFGDVWVGLCSGLALSPLVFSKGNARLTDTLVMMEVMAFDAAVVQAAALARAEPRPYTYADLREWDAEDVWHVDGPLRSPDAWTSSPSWNTSMVAASTFGLATLGLLHAEEHRPVPIVLGYTLAAAATALQGTAEVMARRADPGDVALGAVSGLAIGVLIPLSHRSISNVVDPVRRKQAAERKAAREAR